MSKKQKNGLKDLATIVETEISTVDIASILAVAEDELAAADVAKAYLDDAFSFIEKAKSVYDEKKGVDTEIKALEEKKSLMVKDVNAIEEGIRQRVYRNPDFLSAEEKLKGSDAWEKVMDSARAAVDVEIKAQTEKEWDVIRGIRVELDKLLERSGKLLEEHKQYSDKANELFDLNRQVCRENGLPVRPDKSKKKGGDLSS